MKRKEGYLRKKVWTKTAESIKCKYTGIKLNQALKHKHNSRAFWDLGNGEFMCKSDEAMKKHLEELYPQQLEHDGQNLNAEGELSSREKYLELCKRDGLEPKI